MTEPTYKEVKRYRCRACGRKKFDSPRAPHSCVDGYTKGPWPKGWALSKWKPKAEK